MSEQKEQTYIAKTLEGLEEVLASELAALKATNIIILKRAVSFEGDKEMMYRANYQCRTALRILQVIGRFRVKDEEDLYRQGRNIPWEDYFGVQRTIAVDSVVTDDSFRHSHFIALKLKDAIADRFREKTGKRPSVDVSSPDVRINLHIFRKECTVSLDTSGASLHLRGYREVSGKAPLSEVLASGMILLSGWDREQEFVDLMCGSGTLLIEAAMISYNIPAGYYRKSFGFMNFRSYDREMWVKVREEGNKAILKEGPGIRGYDNQHAAIRGAIANIRSAKVSEQVKVSELPFQETEGKAEGGMIITNPPYGERMTEENLIELYRETGNTLKQKYKGYTAWVLSANPEAIKLIGLKTSSRINLFNGQLPCKFHKFELYAGTRKMQGKPS